VVDSTRLQDLFRIGGQSPWIDNLGREQLRNGSLAEWKRRGIRGVTSNPTIFQKAIAGSDLYDEELSNSLMRHDDIESAYWDLVCSDIAEAADLFIDVYEDSGGLDGFVSIEVSPTLAYDTAGTVEAALSLWDRLARPNVMIKIPATSAGIDALAPVIAHGVNVNVTLIFGLKVYARVLDAFMSGLEELMLRDPTRVSAVASVASFFVSRVDSEIDSRLSKLGGHEAITLQGKAAVAQAKLAYDLFTNICKTERWARLESIGARPQRPLWASTSTKNPSYPDTLYVDRLIGTHSVNTLPEITANAFCDHGTVGRSVDTDMESAREDWRRLGELGIDTDDVARVLEGQGVDAFVVSFSELLRDMRAKAESPS
jgi:transaldolase